LVTLNGSGGARLTIRSDGTELWDYSSDSPMSGTVSSAGRTVSAVLAERGTVTARATSVRNGIFHQDDVVSDYTWQLTFDQHPSPPYTVPWRSDFSYTCSETRLTLRTGDTTSNGATTWQRL
jgi:hypothetical protein